MSETLTEPVQETSANIQPRTEFRIPEYNLLRLQEGFAKLAKRAAKLGVAAPTFTVLSVEKEVHFHALNCDLPGTWVVEGSEPYNRMIAAKDFTGRKMHELSGRVRLMHAIRVEGETPKLAGWKLLAVIEHLPGEGNMLRKVPTAKDDLPLHYREATNLCEHCNTSRPRKETFVLKHDDGTLKQVGRVCIQDFLGGVNPTMLAAGAEFIFSGCNLAAECEDGESGYSKFYGYLIGSVVAMSNAVIRKEGWTSSAVAREHGKTSTASNVAYHLDPPRDAKPSETIHPDEDDCKFSTEAVEWAKNLSENADHELSDYEHNLNVIAKSGVVPRRHMGLSVSLAQAYRRHLGQVEERKHLAATSNYVGEVGKRSSLTVTVLKAISLDSDYGPKTLYIMRDEVGNQIKWFATGAGVDLMEIGGTYSINASIADHTEYKGVKQTLIKRAKLNPTAEELSAQKTFKAEKKLAKKLVAQAAKLQGILREKMFMQDELSRDRLQSMLEQAVRRENRRRRKL